MCCVRTECTASGVVLKVSEKDVIVDALVEGGKASGGPPIGPALGPTGVNIFQVVTKINEVTQPFAGLKVPVKIIVNPNDKSFVIEIGTPPTSALILKEVGASKGSGEPNTTIVGNITVDQLKSVAKGKADDLSALTMKAAIMIITGSCGQMGVTVEGKTAKEFQAEVRAGTWDAQLDEPLRE
jgi:large subunit ribosomal protein L11